MKPFAVLCVTSQQEMQGKHKMPILKFALTATMISLPSAAFACDCPDKPIPAEVLAPQVIEVAEASPPQSAPDMPKLDAPKMAQAAQETQKMSKPRPEGYEAPETPASKYADVLETRLSPANDGLMVFDYAAAKEAGDLAKINAYIDHLTAQNPNEMTDDYAVAYWANLYNAVTLKVVLENYPVKSIRKIGGSLFSPGPWKDKRVTVNGKKLSLDNIEHDIMREKYPSPYIHYMVNCASIGCPNLLPRLWDGETLERDRNKAADAFINSPRGVQVTGDKLTVSSIYDWFEEDFGGNKKGVLAHIKEHANSDLTAAIEAGAKISGYDYDWTLNDG